MKSVLNSSGVYAIVNTENGKMYIGSSVNIRTRRNLHLRVLRRNNHHSRHLQSSYNKRGEEAFEFVVIEFCDIEELVRREQYYMDLWNPEYNSSPTAGNVLGYRHSEETRKKISNALKGHVVTTETREKLSKAKKGCVPHNKGKLMSDATKQKIRLSNLGKHRWTEEQKRQIGDRARGALNGNYGKSVSDATKAIISKAQSVAVYQIDKITGEIIKRYESMREATQELGVNSGSISNCCRGVSKTAGGYRWEYADENFRTV